MTNSRWCFRCWTRRRLQARSSTPCSHLCSAKSVCSHLLELRRLLQKIFLFWNGRATMNSVRLLAGLQKFWPTGKEMNLINCFVIERLFFPEKKSKSRSFSRFRLTHSRLRPTYRRWDSSGSLRGSAAILQGRDGPERLLNASWKLDDAEPHNSSKFLVSEK